MKHARTWSVVIAVLLLGFSLNPVGAISPTAVMVYGDKLTQPVLLRPASPADFPAFGLLWWQAGPYSRPSRTVQGEPQLSSDLKDRAFVNLAIFWGQYAPDQFQAGERQPARAPLSSNGL